MNMENNYECKSFIFRLGKFCKTVDSKVSELKKLSGNVSRSNPQNYDKGLKVFKSELQKLQSMSENAKYKIGEIQQFSFFTASLEEMVSQQEEEIAKMENYLKKFGYVVPEIFEKNNGESLKNLNELSHAPDDQANIVEADHVSNGPLMTPELSDVGKLTLQGKPLPILEIFTTNTGKGYDTTATDNSSPTCTKALTYEATPTNSSIKNIQNWLSNVHAEASFAITPNIITERPVKSMRDRAFQHTASNEFTKEKENINFHGLLGNRNRLLQGPRFEKSGFSYETSGSSTENFEICEQKCILPKANQNKRFTPEEPVLSTIRKLNKVYSTPEEPILNPNIYTTAPSNTAHALLTEGQSNRFTPEEPILSIARTQSMKIDYPTPEEPVLSVFNNRTIDSRKDNVDGEEYYTPEEPSRSYGKDCYYTANKNTAQLISTPQSPQLSDVTKKIMNIRNLHFSRHDSDSLVPAKNQSSCDVNNSKKDLKIPPDEFCLKSPQLSDVTLKIMEKNLAIKL